MKKSKQFRWTGNHTRHSEEVKTEIAEANEIRHHSPDLEIREKCDASLQGLKQFDHKGWRTVAFTFQFLNSIETRCGVKELELLGSSGPKNGSNTICKVKKIQ